MLAWPHLLEAAAQFTLWVPDLLRIVKTEHVRHSFGDFRYNLIYFSFQVGIPSSFPLSWCGFPASFLFLARRPLRSWVRKFPDVQRRPIFVSDLQNPCACRSFRGRLACSFISSFCFSTMVLSSSCCCCRARNSASFTTLSLWGTFGLAPTE